MGLVFSSPYWLPWFPVVFSCLFLSWKQEMIFCNVFSSSTATHYRRKREKERKTKIHCSNISMGDTKLCSVQSLSRVWLFATPWTAAHKASLSITDSWSLLKLMSTESINAIQPSHPPLSTSPPAFNLSQHQGLFIWVSFSHQVAKVLEFQLQHQSFQWIFRTDHI